MNKMGLFIQPQGAGMDLIQHYQPRAVLLMDARAEHIQAVREVSPETEILVWWHEGMQHWSNTDPVWWAITIAEAIKESPPDVVAFWNENLSHDAFDQFPDYDTRQAAFIDCMQGEYGIPVGGFSMAEGNFTRDGPNLAEHFPKSLARLQYIFIHEYWFPRLHSPGMVGYHAQRWPYWLQWLDDAGYGHIQLYVTECGLCSLINDAGPNEGWLGETAKQHGVTDQVYLDDISQYHAYCCQEPRVRAVIPFLTENYRGNAWETFRLASRPDLLDDIMALDAPGEIPEEPPEPPEPPNGGPTMQVFDKQGDEVFGDDALDLIRYHGITVHQPDVAEGDWFWDLIKLEVRCGPACFIFTTLDADDRPLEGEETAWGWEGMDESSNDIIVPYDNDWRERADLGPTNAEGNNGPGFGQSGWWQEPYEPGPGYAWIRDMVRKSVFLTGIGMEAGTQHCTMYATWRIEKKEGGEEPPPPPPGEGVVASLRRMAAELNAVADYLEDADDMADHLKTLSEQLAGML